MVFYRWVGARHLFFFQEHGSFDYGSSAGALLILLAAASKSRLHESAPARVSKVRVVDHRRFEGRCRVTQVRDQNRIAIDHLRAVQNLTEFRPGDGVLNTVVDVYDQNCLRLLGIAVQCAFHQLPMLFDRFDAPTICPNHWVPKITIEHSPMVLHKSRRAAI